MENGIKRGDYVMLKPYMDQSKNPFVDKLYDDNYGRNGLVRKVTYAPSQPWKVAEVIFSGVPYISVVPVIHLTFIRKREEWPLRTRNFPEPNMTVTDRLTVGITKKVRAVFFNIRDCEFEEQCYFEDGKVDILASDALIEHGNPEIKMYYDYEKYEKEKIMENEIKRGDYVVLAGSGNEYMPSIVSKLYDQHRDRIGLVRFVKYAPGYVGKIAEVIFSGVPYISEVPTKCLKRIGERLPYPGKNPKYPAPGMKVVSFGTGIGAEFVHDVIFEKKNDGFEESYSVGGSTFRLEPEDVITYGHPEVKLYYDCGYYLQHVFHDYIDTDIASARTLADLIRYDQNLLKGESTMKNNIKDTIYNASVRPGRMTAAAKILLNSIYGAHSYGASDDSPNPIQKVIFNAPATIVFWKDGSKTVVKAQGDEYDPEKGLAMAVARHYFCDILGMSRYDGIFKKYLPKETKEK